MALITRRQFVQQAAFSASALGYSFHHFERAHILQQGKAKSAQVDVDSIRKMASKISGHVITPDASEYESARHVNNHAYDRYPAVIVRCAIPDAPDLIPLKQKSTENLHRDWNSKRGHISTII
jgi:hypothetical protein